jgi:hypothetical protein
MNPVTWLLSSSEPAIRGMARRDLIGEAEPRDLQDVLDGALVRGLLAGQQEDGGFGGHPYRKWTGVHWRLASLAELEAPGDDPRVRAALDNELDWLTGSGRLAGRPRVHGLPLSDASIEGNGLAAASRLGSAADPRAATLAGALLEWQWPDGGWNCDARASGRRSSFHESLIPMWALFEYGRSTGEADAVAAARRAAELFLEHGVFRRHGTGGPIHPSWTKLHYPPYWHYDYGVALHLLGRMNLVADERATDALDLLEQQRLPDGGWRPAAYWWRPAPSSRTPEAIDWGRRRPSEMLTLNALRVLKAAARA